MPDMLLLMFPSVGPLHSDKEYEVTAQKTGYILTPVPGKQGHFKAFKLGEIIVQVRKKRS